MSNKEQPSGSFDQIVGLGLNASPYKEQKARAYDFELRCKELEGEKEGLQRNLNEAQELITDLSREVAYWKKYADVTCSDLMDQNKRFAELYDRIAKLEARNNELQAAAINLREVKGRYHTEEAMNRLFALL